MRKQTCVKWSDLVRAFPGNTVCFYPKQASLRSVVKRLPRSKDKLVTWYK